ncbi:MAG: hypothetical protein IPJ40_06555 [Saprospirales bacterium]|nr:hypothetical protein [Saprospirales bacterium]
MPTQTLEQTPVMTHYRFSVVDYHRMAELGFSHKAQGLNYWTEKLWK